MISIEKLTPNKLDFLIDYFKQNQNNLKNVIDDFGEIESKNDYGTLFLTSKNPLFRIFWICQTNGKINTIGFGGPNLGLNLDELFLMYPNHTEGFLIYDDLYVYVFFKSKEYDHTVKITSKDKVIENDKVVNNIEINRIEIIFN
jgi:hypothetical protein